MIERLTDRAREVLVNAQRAAQECGHRSIDAPHLLLGLLRRTDTKGCQALNHAGVHYLDVLIAVQEMDEQAPEESGGQASFTPEAKELLAAWVGEAPGYGQGFVETAHLALACSRGGRLPSLEPFVAGREQAIRDAAALQRANQVRTQRARLKRDLRSGSVSIHRFLLDPPDWLETAKVAEVLLSLPKLGRVKVNKLLTQCRISPTKTFGGLSPRQRDDLIKLL